MADIIIDSDSGKFKAGDDADLEIYNNGSHSYIANATASQSIVLRTRASGGSTADAVTIDADKNVTIEGNLTVNKAITFNETSVDADFRVESNGNANMLFVDGGEDRVGVGTNSPQTILHITENTNSNLEIDGSVAGEMRLISINDARNAYEDLVFYGDTVKSISSEFHVSGSGSPSIRVTDTTNTVTGKFQADDTVGKVGTHTNHAFEIFTNNSTRVSVANNGPVTISENLIVGSARTLTVGSVSDEGDAIITNGADGGRYDVLTVQEDGNARWNLSFEGSSSTNSLTLNSNSTSNVMHWDNATGNVGIGTTTPAPLASATNYMQGPALNITETSGRGEVTVQGSTEAILNLVDTGGGTDDKWIRLEAGAGKMRVQSVNDAGDAYINDKIMCFDFGGNVGIGTDSPGAKIDIVQANSDRGLEVNQTGNNNAIYSITGSGIDQSNYVGVAEATDYTSHQLNFGCYATASDSWNLMIGHHGDGSSSPWSDVIFNVEGNGDVEGDGSYSSTAGDYAEYFESKDGKAIPVGTTVKLDNGKLVACSDGETPIGVIRPKQGACSVIGNKGQLGWSKKYKRDDYGGVVLEDNNQQYSDEYDSSQEYIPREKRDEWNLVGLLGQVQITKGQPMSSSWVKMWDVSDTVEMWFVK